MHWHLSGDAGTTRSCANVCESRSLAAEPSRRAGAEERRSKRPLHGMLRSAATESPPHRTPAVRDSGPIRGRTTPLAKYNSHRANWPSRRAPRAILLPRSSLIKTNPLDQAAWNYRPVLGAIQRKRFDMVAELLPPKVDSLLEVGYGSGVLMPELARHCSSLHGVDTHSMKDSVADVLHDRGISAELIEAPADALPYDDSRFDCVVGVSCLEFVDDIDATCVELSRVLRTGGLALFITPGFSPLLDGGLRLLTGERAEDTFQGRRQDVLPALRRHFQPQSERRFPRLPSAWLYTAFAGIRLE